jgi:hypothetical protein
VVEEQKTNERARSLSLALERIVAVETSAETRKPPLISKPRPRLHDYKVVAGSPSY